MIRSGSKYLFVLMMTALTVICSPFVMYADQKSDKIIEATAAKIKTAKALSISFTIDMAGAPSTRGQLTMSGRQFQLITPGMTIWYDGTTQWTYIAKDKEVSITTPTSDEIAETNPFEVIANSKQKYNSRLLSQTAATEVVDMKSKSAGSAISNVLLTIDRQSGWPHNIVVNFDNGTTTNLIVNAIAVQKQLPAETFRFNAKQYKDTEIIDLR